MLNTRSSVFVSLVSRSARACGVCVLLVAPVFTGACVYEAGGRDTDDANDTFIDHDFPIGRCLDLAEFEDDESEREAMIEDCLTLDDDDLSSAEDPDEQDAADSESGDGERRPPGYEHAPQEHAARPVRVQARRS